MPKRRGAPIRYRLEDERKARTWKLKIGDLQGAQMWSGKKPPEGRSYYVKAYVTTGEYEDGELGEVFISPDKEGSFLKGILDGFALLLSICLQHGIPLEEIVAKFLNMRFAPSGFTNDKEVPMAKSFYDLVFRKLAIQYLDKETCDELGVIDRSKEGSDTLQEEDDGPWEENEGTKEGINGQPFKLNEHGLEKEFKSDTDAPDGKKARES